MAESDAKDDQFFKYVVTGGGIAGVSCIEMLSSLCPEDKLLLLTASPLVKAVTNFRKVTKTLEEFEVEEKPMYEFSKSFPNVTVRHQKVSHLDSKEKRVQTSDGCSYLYERLCLCTGGAPKVIAKDNAYVLGIRDTETVKVFQKKLTNARRIIIVGNGGIATELAYEVEGCEVIWAIKDKSITSTFIDAGAAKFFLPALSKDKPPATSTVKRTKYRKTDDVHSESAHVTSQSPGGALGPDWHEGLEMKGSRQESHRVLVEYKVEVADVLSAQQFKSSSLTAEETVSSRGLSATADWPVYVKLTNGKVYGCDFVVSATGVTPTPQPFTDNNELTVCAEDGGVSVDDQMRTSVSDVYAAGDVCHANWDPSAYWVQMRLWSQARQMGAYSAQCMAAHANGEQMTLDFCFEMFAHVTIFFNYKVILLGKFNAQGLGSDYQLLLRVTPDKEYIKVILKDGRMHGAILIGDTDLEETFENLILNQMDLTAFGADLLDPNIDIEDFFD